ncbi:hypothetical protein NDU88_002535 [Pleurodeles waltl]|uniref:Uncharacterized protein n=1 Tax=Pleurodeles waltl TaxID=8319 RepID=A0AAV7MP70_PLEWA|nr:hypothetical protein NDU88_002535 [Pleurodeles waltl]
MEPAEWEGATGAVAPSRISVSAKQTLKFFVGPSYGGPCSAHAIGMGTAGAPRGPTTPHTAILLLAGEPPGTGWRYGLSESPWRRSKLRRHGGFPWAAESPPAFRFWPRLYRRGQNARRSTASLLAVLPPTSAMATPPKWTRLRPITQQKERCVDFKKTARVEKKTLDLPRDTLK